MKRSLSILLAIMMVLTLVPMGTFNITANADTSGYYTYEVANGKATITDCSTSISGDVTIPSTLGGYPVTSIGDNAFYNCTNLTSITIPDSVTSIGDSAFYGCDSLTNITIPDSVTSIGNSAFDSCESLTSITIPDGVTSIGINAFMDCDSLTSITIPDSVTSIDSHAFFSCDSLTSITIPDSVTSIGNSAFAYCYSLTSITIPDSVTSIDSGAFRNCTSLTSITILDSVTSIGNSAFYYCTRLTSVYYIGSEQDRAKMSIGSNNTPLKNATWYYNACIGSATHTYDNACDKDCNVCGVERETDHSFEWIIDIDATMFETGLKHEECSVCGAQRHLNTVVDVLAGGYVYTVTDGKATITDCDTSISGNVTIPSTLGGYPVTSIGDNAFYNCTNLTSITIPDSVTSIGNYAFRNCDSLTSITIPNSVTSIGNSAFYWCYSLTSITIPDSVTSIGDGAFSGCSSLTSITIPDSVTSIGDGAFYSCTSLTSITIPDSVTSIGDGAFSDCSSLTSVTIGDSVTSIGNSAFYWCQSLKSITIPDSVTSIGNSAFEVCTSLTSITIPDSVTSIGYDAFFYCKSLTSITIPDSVTSIGDGAFSDCTSLTSITIPDSVTSIGNYAFYKCTSLTSVYYIGNEQDRAKISIGSNNTALVNATWYYNACIGSAKHTYDNTCDEECNVCGHIREIVHTYDNACDKDCNICGEERETQHNYISGKCDGCNSYIESKHNYIEETDEIWVITKENTASIKITFSSDTFVEEEWDFIYIYDANGDLVGQYTGGELASKTVTVSGNTAKIRLFSDKINTAYGFRVVNIEFECAHNYTAKITKPTCLEQGYTTYTCEHCDYSYVDDYVAANGHNYSHIVTEPTCTEKGFTTYVCISCDYSYVGDYVAANGHSYSVSVKEPTCTEKGFTTYVCISCDYSYVGDYVNETGHNYSHIVKEPICIEGGYTTHTCENCGDVYTDSYTSATGVHVYENGNCTQCNAYLESEHNYTDLFDKTWSICRKGATSVTVTFSSETFVEQRYDYIYIYDGNDNLIGEYTGDALASKSITVNGDTVKIRLKTDRSQTYYGFKITDIYAEYVVGDANGDGKTDVKDIVRLKKILSGLDVQTTPASDVDGDGDVTMVDLVLLAKYIVEKMREPIAAYSEKISDLSWGVIEETTYGYRYTILDFKNNFFGNMGCETKYSDSALTFNFNGEIYNVNFAEAAVFPNNAYDIKNCIEYEDEEYLVFYPYTKKLSDTEYIKFQRLSRSMLKVVENTATEEFYNFTVGKILSSTTIEII